MVGPFVVFWHEKLTNVESGRIRESIKAGFPVTKVPGPFRLEQLMVEMVVMLNSMSLWKAAKSGAFVAITLCISMVLIDITW
ncbi:hypothetical protein HanIR_Chr08g0368681 [Helianthus annuus]|nr:hypothetical protein HanIR_Chr08g0368681 [Helianthus annuus]